MAKLAITMFAFLLLVASAYAHRTTITTVEIDEEEMLQSKGRCRQQIKEADLSQCERFITQSTRQQEMAMMSTRSQSLQKCCSQMRRLDDECQCKALEQIVRESEREDKQKEDQEQQEMIERAQKVVIYCRLPQRCQWGSAWF